MRKNVGPPADQAPDIEGNRHICLTVPIEHVIAEREATKDRGLLARLNAE